MTTKAAERLYLAQHLYAVEGRKSAIFNPNNLPLEALPVIYGFNNGGGGGCYSAVAIAQDGTCLGGHCCSDEGYMPSDLGILEGTRTDRHENDYQKHYPRGYRMEFVPSSDIANHAGIQEAFAANKVKP